MTEQKITPCLWFDFNAEEAVAHYLSIFPNSRIMSTARYGEFAPGRKGAVMTIFFEIDGQRFLALNGGPHYKFTPALSLMVNCDDQAEIDALWEKLAEGGEHVECGWLTDKFGVSWQIVPRVLPELLGGDAERTDRVMRAVMSMKKLDIAQMEEAASARIGVERHRSGPRRLTCTRAVTSVKLRIGRHTRNRLAPAARVTKNATVNCSRRPRQL